MILPNTSSPKPLHHIPDQSCDTSASQIAADLSSADSADALTSPGHPVGLDKISESIGPVTQDQPRGVRRRRRSDSGEAGSGDVERKRSKIDTEGTAERILATAEIMNGNGATSSGIGGASLSARIRRADFSGEWMYPEDAVKAGYTAEEEDVGKGKGKARDIDVDDASEASRKSSGEHVMPVKREEFVRLVLQALREVGYRYVIRPLCRSPCLPFCSQTAEVLRAESGFEEENQTATALRNAILGGRWSESITLLESLGVVQPGDRLPLRRKNSFTTYGKRQSGNNSDVTTPGSTPVTIPGSEAMPSGSALSISPSTGFGKGGLTPAASLETGRFGQSFNSNGFSLTDDDTGLTDERHVEPSPEDSIGRQAIFKIYEQKYFELLELEQQNRALSVLRHQLAPIAAESDRLHALSRCLFKGKAALYEERGWDGARGNSRMRLLYQLQGMSTLILSEPDLTFSQSSCQPEPLFRLNDWPRCSTKRESINSSNARITITNRQCRCCQIIRASEDHSLVCQPTF